MPLASLATSPPGYTWPSSGAGANSTTITEGVNAINGNNGYEYGFNITNGPIWIDHCDLWGFGDAIVIQTTTAQMTITNNQMHDIANPSEQAYHTDGPGYSNGGTAPNNVMIIGNAVAMLGTQTPWRFKQRPAAIKISTLQTTSGLGITPLFHGAIRVRAMHKLILLWKRARYGCHEFWCSLL